MHVAAVAVHTDFEQRLASVGKSAPYASMPSGRNIGLTSDPHSFGPVVLRTVTPGDLDDIRERYRKLTVQPFALAHVKADAGAVGAAVYERLVYDLERDAEADEARIATRGAYSGEGEGPAEIASWLINKEGWDAPAGSVSFGAVVSAVRSGTHQGRAEIAGIMGGKLAPPSPPRPAAITKKSAPTLRDIVDQYLANKKLPTRTEGEVKSSLRLFENVCGGTKRLDALTKSDFQAYAEYLAKQKVGGKTEGSVVRPASLSTVKKRIGLLRSAINHAIDTGRFAGVNPASGIKAEAYVAAPNKAIMPSKRRFTVAEMNLIFQHPWFTGCLSSSQTHAPGTHRLKGVEYWAPVMAALTGCRASELGGLMLAEVMLDDPHPYILIRDNQYRRTKGGYARKVPILDALFELGFKDYMESVAKTGADRLFPDWVNPKGKGTSRNDDKAWSNAKILRSFNRTVIPKMLEGKLLAGARQEVTFHSFRGAFKAMLSGSDYKLHPNIVNEVVGHSKNELDARYIGEIPIEETYPAVRGCRYNGLIIPSLPAGE